MVRDEAQVRVFDPPAAARPRARDPRRDARLETFAAEDGPGTGEAMEPVEAAPDGTEQDLTDQPPAPRKRTGRKASR